MDVPVRPGALGLLLALAACAGGNEGLEVPVTEAGVKRPIAPSTFAEGPAIGSSEELVTWLEANTEVIQLPVAIQSGPIGVGEARVATADGAVALRLDDTALGISLHDRVREHCGEAEVCSLWLEGRWQGAEPVGGLEAHRYEFQVLRVVGPVAATDEARIRVVTP